MLDPVQLGADQTLARLRVCAYVRKLRVHLALEERFIYARLISQSDPVVVGVVEHHRQAARALAATVARYAAQWTTSGDEAIETACVAFVDQTKTLLQQVSARFEGEEANLYPIVDQVRMSSNWSFEVTGEADEKSRAG